MSVLFSAGLGVMVLLNRPDFSNWVDEVLGSHVAGIVRNLVIVGAFASMQLFYLRNIAEYRPRQRRYVEIVALTATVLVILIVPMFVMAPFELSFTSRDIQDPAVLVFFVSVSVYLVYACITQVFWASRDSVSLYKERAWDLLVVAVSLAVGCVVYLILLGARVSYYAQVLFGSGSVSINMWSGGLVAIRVSVLAMLLAVFYPGAVADLKATSAPWSADVLLCAARASRPSRSIALPRTGSARCTRRQSRNQRNARTCLDFPVSTFM
ncbi:hypothetical protein [Pseudonocardia sp. ICBG1034]|uniref:hypothetical protein n=1 Tax=Pseudonocardia sp. ICBG1034 TaxID=2844381 RepID=UPI001CCC9929|nr:hypothetical protein [Pseudonocardia sp. ICBG1034]